jgi:hypothetical protein
MEKSTPNMWATFVSFQKQPKWNDRPKGENLPNLVTLISILATREDEWLVLVQQQMAWLSILIRTISAIVLTAKALPDKKRQMNRTKNSLSATCKNEQGCQMVYFQTKKTL